MEMLRWAGLIISIDLKRPDQIAMNGNYSLASMPIAWDEIPRVRSTFPVDRGKVSTLIVCFDAAPTLLA